MVIAELSGVGVGLKQNVPVKCSRRPRILQNILSVEALSPGPDGEHSFVTTLRPTRASPGRAHRAARGVAKGEGGALAGR